MATIKSYTDIKQSRKLAEILPIDSADMRYSPLGDSVHPWVLTDNLLEKDAVPCWSLAALLGVLPLPDLIQDKADGELFWLCSVYYEDGNFIETYDNDPVDACYEMIIHLHERKLL